MIVSIRLFFLFFILSVAGANAYVPGGTNFGILGYPEHSCRKPFKPYQFNDQYELDNYRDEVQAYIDCINEYVENAGNDIERIKESAESAIGEANGY
jgi:hypothetical protein